jgi:hypothetical protein
LEDEYSREEMIMRRNVLTTCFEAEEEEVTLKCYRKGMANMATS